MILAPIMFPQDGFFKAGCLKAVTVTDEISKRLTHSLHTPTGLKQVLPGRLVAKPHRNKAICPRTAYSVSMRQR